jgi:uncharacterized protein YidB (DUF937 family)
MSFLDAIKSAAGGFAEQEAHQALDGALQNTSVGGMSGLLGQLSQGGLGDQVQGWLQGEGGQVTGDAIKAALGDEHIQSIASQLGINPDDVASQLAANLPGMAQAHAADQGGSDDSDNS